VLQAVGGLREDEWDASIQEAGLTKILDNGEDYFDFNDFLQEVQNLEVNEEVFAREITISAEIGAFNISGRIDFIILRWINGIPVLNIVETKASRRDRTYHRIQVALYLMMAQRLLAENIYSIGGQALSESNLQCMIACIDETTNEPQSIFDLEPIIELEREEADIERLLSQNGPFSRIIQTDLSSLNYRIDQKCDGCVFNSDCLPESGRLRRLELLGIDPSGIQVLNDFDVIDIDGMADLDLETQQASQIQNDPRFTNRLDVLRQTAGSRRTTLPGGMDDPDSFPVTSLPSSSQSQLPEHEIDGDRLVRVYLNIDYDYIENRLVALSACKGPRLSTSWKWKNHGVLGAYS
jgi:predicted RecB family nuclease